MPPKKDNKIFLMETKALTDKLLKDVAGTDKGFDRKLRKDLLSVRKMAGKAVNHSPDRRNTEKKISSESRKYNG